MKNYFAIVFLLLSGCAGNDMPEEPEPVVPDTIHVPIDTIDTSPEPGVDPKPEPKPDPEPCAATWSKDIQLIISTRCAKPGCHVEGTGRTPLSSYAKVFEARFMIRLRVESGSMPYDGPLHPDQKQKILCWIEAGALEN